MPSPFGQTWGTAGQAITVTLASLASGSARAGTAIDFTALGSIEDVLIQIAVKTGTGTISGQKAVNVYCYGTADGATTYTGGAELGGTPGTDGAASLLSPTNLILLGTINVAAQNATYPGGPWSFAQAFGLWLPARGGIVIENQTGVALDSTEGNHLKVYQAVGRQY